jgi:hypothetical protein
MSPRRHCASPNLPQTDDPNTRPIIRPPPFVLQISVSSPLPQIPSPPRSSSSAIAPAREHRRARASTAAAAKISASALGLAVPGCLPGRAHRNPDPGHVGARGGLLGDDELARGRGAAASSTVAKKKNRRRGELERLPHPHRELEHLPHPHRELAELPGAVVPALLHEREQQLDPPA